MFLNELRRQSVAPSISKQTSRQHSQGEPPSTHNPPPSPLQMSMSPPAGASVLRNILASANKSMATVELSRVEWLYGKKAGFIFGRFWAGLHLW